MHKPAGQKNATTLQSKKRRVLRPFMLPLCAGQSIERWRNAAGGGDGASPARSATGASQLQSLRAGFCRGVLWTGRHRWQQRRAGDCPTFFVPSSVKGMIPMFHQTKQPERMVSPRLQAFGLGSKNMSRTFRKPPSPSPQNCLDARCSVRPVAGNPVFLGRKNEAQPRPCTFCGDFFHHVDMMLMGALHGLCPVLPPNAQISIM